MPILMGIFFMKISIRPSRSVFYTFYREIMGNFSVNIAICPNIFSANICLLFLGARCIIRTDMKVKRFVSDLDRIMSLIYDDVPLPPREVKSREFPVWEERAREAVPLQKNREDLRYKKAFRPKPARPEIRIDLNALSGIRADAEYTMEKLMTDEEREPEPVCPEAAPSNGPASIENQAAAMEPAAFEDGTALFGLDALEYRILNCLLSGKNLAEVDLKGKILSVLIDGINEKLFDEIGDLVIENESSPVLIEDYRDELMEMFAK